MVWLRSLLSKTSRNSLSLLPFAALRLPWKKARGLLGTARVPASCFVSSFIHSADLTGYVIRSTYGDCRKSGRERGRRREGGRGERDSEREREKHRCAPTRARDQTYNPGRQHVGLNTDYREKQRV
uniref:Uncharacterized protein n=1 Tax=Molossus molossus TaxID=27622 RepID=A0A7J8IAC1_MOLMO|nr:hypothetical protein HJG59_010707 [Molossus molossus]